MKWRWQPWQWRRSDSPFRLLISLCTPYEHSSNIANSAQPRMKRIISLSHKPAMGNAPISELTFVDSRNRARVFCSLLSARLWFLPHTLFHR